MADLFVALDVPRPDDALALVERIGPLPVSWKVGLELFARGGPGLVADLRTSGRPIFLDLKLHDIPNTVAGAAAAAAVMEADYLTVHASGGGRMVEAARRAVEGSRTRILAVTVLTSLSPEEHAEIRGVGGGSADAVAADAIRLAALATAAGAHGVVASAGEVAGIRARLGADVVVAVPGIRLDGGRSIPQDDQRRVFGPAEAIRAGADLLVVGRPITRAADPAAVVERYLSAMEGDSAMGGDSEARGVSARGGGSAIGIDAGTRGGRA